MGLRDGWTPKSCKGWERICFVLVLEYATGLTADDGRAVFCRGSACLTWICRVVNRRGQNGNRHNGLGYRPGACGREGRRRKARRCASDDVCVDRSWCGGSRGLERGRREGGRFGDWRRRGFEAAVDRGVGEEVFSILSGDGCFHEVIQMGRAALAPVSFSPRDWRLS